MRFTGKERDGETGLDYFGARYHLSTTGRFSSPDEPFADSFLVNPQSMNLYSYTWNSPTRYFDEDGRAINGGLAVAGGAIGFTTSFVGSAVAQYLKSSDGHIDWGKALAYGIGGGASGALAGLTFGGSLASQALVGAGVGTAGSVDGGILSRSIAGEEVFSSDSITSDFVSGAIGAAAGAGVQFLGTVIKLPAMPKPPSVYGSVSTQLKRLNRLHKWAALRDQLSYQWGLRGGVFGATLSGVAIPMKEAYDIQKSVLAWETLREHNRPRQKDNANTSKFCYTSIEGKYVCESN